MSDPRAASDTSPLDPSLAMAWIRPLAWFAVAAPTWLAFNVSPSATFLNQVLALLGWGFLAASVAWLVPLGRDAARRAGWAWAAPGAVLAVLSLCAVLSASVGSLPAPLAASALGMLAAAAVACAAGARAGAAGVPVALGLWRALCEGLVMAGGVHVLLAAVQVFAPHLADGQWIARSGLPGRTVGNLRQPNHVCTLMLLAMVALVALAPAPASRPSTFWSRPARPSSSAFALWLGMAMFSWTLVATASRTALIGLLLLLLWGVLDRSLAAAARRVLVAAPLLYAGAWGLMAWWSETAHKTFGAQERLGEADLSASRLAIWRDSLELLRMHPWGGVGFGEFNFAWSLTVLPNRPVAFFDHTHNLLLHWAVELGIPVALLLTALLVWSLWRLAGAAVARNTDGTRARVLRPLLVAVLMLAVHSQLEYPLWYAYFLLPAACWLGLGLALAQGVPPPGAPAGDTEPAALAEAPGGHRSAAAAARQRLVRWWGQARDVRGAVAGLLLAVGALVALADYQRVVNVFAADAQQPLPQRIAAGQRSWFFAHHADYAAATVAPEPALEMEALRRAAHHLLDTRLMMAWAEAYASSGDLPRARYLAGRLREFRNPLSKPYFDVCTAPPPNRPETTSGPDTAAGTPPVAEPLLEPPYQCRGPDPQVKLRWSDFR